MQYRLYRSFFCSLVLCLYRPCLQATTHSPLVSLAEVHSTLPLRNASYTASLQAKSAIIAGDFSTHGVGGVLRLADTRSIGSSHLSTLPSDPHEQKAADEKEPTGEIDPYTVDTIASCTCKQFFYNQHAAYVMLDQPTLTTAAWGILRAPTACYYMNSHFITIPSVHYQWKNCHGEATKACIAIEKGELALFGGISFTFEFKAKSIRGLS